MNFPRYIEIEGEILEDKLGQCSLPEPLVDAVAQARMAQQLLNALK